MLDDLTYLGFHLWFTVPPILIVGGIMIARHRAVLREMAPGILLICVVAVVYTTPWDNYLVFKQVWSYGPDRVLGTIGYVPVEEYAFFVLQTIMTGLLLSWRIAVRPGKLWSDPSAGQRWGVGIVLIGISLVGVAALFNESTLYFGLITAWAFPVLALQWFFGPGTLWTSGHIWIPVVAGATVYLAGADAVAISSGTWNISDVYTTGVEVGPLPFEEGLFFLVTNLLVAWGLVLVRAFSTRREHPTP